MMYWIIFSFIGFCFTYLSCFFGVTICSMSRVDHVISSYLPWYWPIVFEKHYRVEDFACILKLLFSCFIFPASFIRSEPNLLVVYLVCASSLLR